MSPTKSVDPTFSIHVADTVRVVRSGWEDLPIDGVVAGISQGYGFTLHCGDKDVYRYSATYRRDLFDQIRVTVLECPHPTGT